MATKAYTLSTAKLAILKDAIVLVLSDYRSTQPSPLTTAHGQLEIANRVIDNLKVVAERKVR